MNWEMGSGLKLVIHKTLHAFLVYQIMSYDYLSFISKNRISSFKPDPYFTLFQP
jgi:hypothetical protein